MATATQASALIKRPRPGPDAAALAVSPPREEATLVEMAGTDDGATVDEAPLGAGEDGEAALASAPAVEAVVLRRRASKRRRLFGRDAAAEDPLTRPPWESPSPSPLEVDTSRAASGALPQTRPTCVPPAFWCAGRAMCARRSQQRCAPPPHLPFAIVGWGETGPLKVWKSADDSFWTGTAWYAWTALRRLGRNPPRSCAMRS